MHYQHVCERLRDLITREKDLRVLVDLLERLTFFEQWTDTFVATELRILWGRERLTEAMVQLVHHQHLMGAVRLGMPGVDRMVPHLWRLSETLTDSERLVLDVLLRRLVDPFEALMTIPLDALFSQTEQDQLLNANRSRQASALAEESSGSTSRPRPGRGICAIVKFTRLCNLRCVYCHDWAAGVGHTMPFDVQLRLFEKLFGPPEHRRVTVVWHGGEPMMIGRRNALRVLFLERWFQRPGQRLLNSMQTNGTLINADWIQFLRHFGIRTSLSIDGPAEVHDHTRPQVHGRPTFDKSLRGLRLLQEAGLLAGVLIVVTPQLLDFGAERLVAFLRESNIRSIELLPLRPDNNSAQPLDHSAAQDFVGFLWAVDRARVEQGEHNLYVRTLDTALSALAGQAARHCEFGGNCAGDFFSIDPAGDVSHCDKYLGDSDYRLGNLRSHNFDEMRRGEAMGRISAEIDAGLEAMKSCQYFRYCNGWCPHEHYLNTRPESSDRVDCCGLGGLFEAALRDESDTSRGRSAPSPLGPGRVQGLGHGRTAPPLQSVHDKQV